MILEPEKKVARRDEIWSGDVVMLKSGGPLMTVQSVAEETEVGPAANCIWFDEFAGGGYSLGAGALGGGASYSAPASFVRMPHIESFPLHCLVKP